ERDAISVDFALVSAGSRCPGYHSRRWGRPCLMPLHRCSASTTSRFWAASEARRECWIRQHTAGGHPNSGPDPRVGRTEVYPDPCLSWRGGCEGRAAESARHGARLTASWTRLSVPRRESRGKAVQPLGELQ